MHIVNCLHPITVYNRYTRQKVQVSCGKCKACKQARQQKWINRLQDERKCWRYCFELYLDYNDQYLPTYDFCQHGDYLCERQRRFYVKNVDSSVITLPVKDLLTGNLSSDEYVISRLNTHYTALPHPSVRDIQLFKKRLNKYIYEEFGSYRTFRSAIAAEIGPTTFRPHYHGIIFFSDPRLSAKISRLVYRAWQDGCGNSLGHAYARPDRGGICSYVAKYICRPSDLPLCYSNPNLRPFFLTSNRPPIGSLLQSSKEVREIFFAANPQRIGFKVQDNKTLPVAIPQTECIENRLFPKCPLYCQVSSTLRTDLYKSVIGSRGLLVDFDEYLQAIVLRIANFHFFGEENCGDGWPASIGHCKPSQFADMIGQITHGFTSPDALKLLHSVSLRVWYQSQIFGVSFDFYLKQIYLYYDRKEILKLRSFYSFQQDYCLKYPVSDIYSMYQFASPPGSYKDTKDYQYFRSDTLYLWNESRKTLKKNAYFESLKEKDNPLYKLVKNYYYGEKCDEAVETTC